MNTGVMACALIAVLTFGNAARAQQQTGEIFGKVTDQSGAVMGGSGLGNVFINAKWLYKLSGLYELPYGIRVSGFFKARRGYPEQFAVARLVPQLDIFNVFNNNIIQAVRVTENAANANQIQAITAPRVVRFGLELTW